MPIPNCAPASRRTSTRLSHERKRCCGVNSPPSSTLPTCSSTSGLSRARCCRRQCGRRDSSSLSAAAMRGSRTEGISPGRHPLSRASALFNAHNEHCARAGGTRGFPRSPPQGREESVFEKDEHENMESLPFPGRKSGLFLKRMSIKSWPDTKCGSWEGWRGPSAVTGARTCASCPGGTQV